MTLLSLGIGCCLAFLILTRIISTSTVKRRCQAEATRQGCEPAPVVPKKGFLGLTQMLDYLKATREERGPPHFVDTMDGMGKSGTVHTARVEGDSRPIKMEISLKLTQTVLGSEVLVTRDPENVKAVFLTHASSFEIGASRCVCIFSHLLSRTT